jgi:hypothetical protein
MLSKKFIENGMVINMAENQQQNSKEINNEDEAIEEAREHWEGVHNDEGYRQANPAPDFFTGIVPGLKTMCGDIWKSIRGERN